MNTTEENLQLCAPVTKRYLMARDFVMGNFTTYGVRSLRHRPVQNYPDQRRY